MSSNGQLHSNTDAETLPAVMTMEEGASLIRCSKAHMSHVLNGKVKGLPRLPSIQIGRRRLIRRESLLKWLEAFEHGGLLSARLDSPSHAHERSNLKCV